MMDRWRQKNGQMDGDGWMDGYKDIELGIQMLEILQIH